MLTSAHQLMGVVQLYVQVVQVLDKCRLLGLDFSLIRRQREPLGSTAWAIGARSFQVISLD
jgi:hypothetical protein